MKSKANLRQELRVHRASLPHDIVVFNSSKIAKSLYGLVDWPSVKTVHMYQDMSAYNEVITTEIRAYIDNFWPQIAITSAAMQAIAPIPMGQFDIIIVPLLGFDTDNYRLGLGSGWYDRFLATQTDAKTFGLAHEMQKLDYVPREVHDQSLDYVITELNVYKR